MKKKPNYKGFIKHLKEYQKKRIPTSKKDLKKLAVIYNCPIPKKK